jgi:site-specific recombinase XerD
MTVRKRYSRYYYTDFYVKGKRFVNKVPGGITIQRMAQEYENDLKLKMLKDKIGIDDTDYELSDLVSRYLEYSRVNKAASSFKRDELALRTFSTITGLTKLSEVTPVSVEHYKAERFKDVSKKTVNIEIKTLKAMFNKLVALGILHENPIRSVTPLPGPESPAIEFLEKAEVDALLRAASPTYRPIIYCFLKTGLRRSELVYLEWSDIDFGNKRIRVINKDGHQTKWHRERHIPIDNKLSEIIRAFPRRNRYIFTTKDGNLRKNNLVRILKNIAKKAGIKKNVTVHMLRHTYASHLVMAGVPLRTVADLLGHASIVTTLRYSHLAPDHLNGAVEKLPF